MMHADYFRYFILNHSKTEYTINKPINFRIIVSLQTFRPTRLLCKFISDLSFSSISRASNKTRENLRPYLKSALQPPHLNIPPAPPPPGSDDDGTMAGGGCCRRISFGMIELIDRKSDDVIEAAILDLSQPQPMSAPRLHACVTA